MKLEFDFDELVQFGRRLNNPHNYETALMTATQEVARVLHKCLLNKTPVDTGNLRKTWSAGDNLAFKVEKKYGGYQGTFVNEAENEYGFKYGRAVNYGHRLPHGKRGERRVPGKFFVENSVIETEEVAQKIIMKELRKWFEGGMNGK